MIKRVAFFSIIFLLIFQTSTSIQDEVKTSLINFIKKLSGDNSESELHSSWNASSDPCRDQWKGVDCDALNIFIRKLYLNSSNLSGELDIDILCKTESLANSLAVLDLSNNHAVTGEISSSISSCKRLTWLRFSSNKLSGPIPDSLATLSNLKALDISNNNLTGKLPAFNYSNLIQFNVSNNDLAGRVPGDVVGRFDESSFIGNPRLCGDPLPNECRLVSSELESESESSGNIAGQSSMKHSSSDRMIMFGGYILLGFVCAFIALYLLYKKRNRNSKIGDNELPQKVESSPRNMNKFSTIMTSSMERNSGFGGNNDDDSAAASSLVVLRSPPEAKGLRFEDLLRAPAEMLGRGKGGSMYKVDVESCGKSVVVKRIKNWGISSNEFRERMKRLDQVKHPNVLPPLAFYCSNREKLLVYDYQPFASLFKFLHGTKTNKQTFDWTSRLNVATTLAESLTFMHNTLRDDQIPHGNFKSSNIFLNTTNMEPCISEYGLITTTATASTSPSFSDDVYAFGVVLLELLTGNMVRHDGVDLADWVRCVVREEWTEEVFDKSLISECACEERMVGLLQVAIKCVNKAQEIRPKMSQVLVMVNAIKEEEERSAMLSFVSREM